MMLGLMVLGVYIFFAAIFAYLYDVRIDWTKDKELILWYTVSDWFTGRKERKFVKILKL